MKSKHDRTFLVRSIGYFVALSRNLSYTETAAQLGISQPALTQQIKKLEESVGTPLFYIEGKRIHLTEAGEIFLNATQKVNSIFSEANDEIKQVSENHHDTVTIGIINSMPANVIIDFIVKFKEEEPNVDFNVKSVMRYGLRSQIESDSVDVLIIYLPDNSFIGLNNYKTYRFCRTELLLVSPFKIKDGNKITLEEARKYPWVGYPEGYYLDRIIAEQFRKQNILLPKYSAHFSQVENILNFSQKANTLTAIPEICLPFVKEKSYIYHFSPAIKFDIALIYRPSKLKIPIFNKTLNAFNSYLTDKDFLTRLKELVEEQ
ncbi:LysR family transcriptional regulator [Xylocopilactobacillus apicola]|uniref:LysR family transcriptional regulator n=1 Tax=Xylocopilactobacillus apicola TaxID=2932184 RepID=A0AAU9DAL8_9LACO|nr:LysR family transcriptional regulator [Xylocopilactobacillus apicola]BDR58585.1 LysR family transcriptional regulator [Xylocopilactobacillus apicola]